MFYHVKPFHFLLKNHEERYFYCILLQLSTSFFTIYQELFKIYNKYFFWKKVWFDYQQKHWQKINNDGSQFFPNEYMKTVFKIIVKSWLRTREFTYIETKFFNHKLFFITQSNHSDIIFFNTINMWTQGWSKVELFWKILIEQSLFKLETT